MSVEMSRPGYFTEETYRVAFPNADAASISGYASASKPLVEVDIMKRLIHSYMVKESDSNESTKFLERRVWEAKAGRSRVHPLYLYPSHRVSFKFFTAIKKRLDELSEDEALWDQIPYYLDHLAMGGMP